nr:immunoglobulin heavy chain junction region [Macaca mulatta]MOW33129.1 immunoglobulin heavy chain junction region [Macaca mulatta]
CARGGSAWSIPGDSW